MNNHETASRYRTRITLDERFVLLGNGQGRFDQRFTAAGVELLAEPGKQVPMITFAAWSEGEHTRSKPLRRQNPLH
jgi:hypothetical protein